MARSSPLPPQYGGRTTASLLAEWLQGFQMLLDQQSGFGAVAEELLHAIGDDFGRLPTVLFSLAPASAPPRPSGQVSCFSACPDVVQSSLLRNSLRAMTSHAGRKSQSAWSVRNAIHRDITAV